MHTSHLIIALCSLFSGSTVMLLSYASGTGQARLSAANRAPRRFSLRARLDASLLRDAVSAVLLLSVALAADRLLRPLANASPADALTLHVCLYAGLAFAVRFAWRLGRRCAA